jgi:hypothetical protein
VDDAEVSKETYTARMLALLGMHPQELEERYEVVACLCSWEECPGWQLHPRTTKEDDGE